MVGKIKVSPHHSLWNNQLLLGKKTGQEIMTEVDNYGNVAAIMDN